MGEWPTGRQRAAFAGGSVRPRWTALALRLSSWRAVLLIRYLRPFVVVLAVAGGEVRSAAQNIADEYRLKAAFVYQFPQFVEWPAGAVEAAPAISLCVARPSPFGPVLEQLVRGESLKGRPLTVREIASAADLAGCHVVFAPAKSGLTAGLLKAAAGRPILTVGDADRFLDAGGIIALRVVDRRVRFEVNVAAAKTAGLHVSSQLLDLALRVHGGPS